ncbi:MAG: hypothetical protein ACRDTT_02715 [Pseudonocardiaceae bacterium]
MLREDQETEQIVARVAALDIGQAEVVWCVRVPHGDKPGATLPGGEHALHDDPVAAGDG